MSTEINAVVVVGWELGTIDLDELYSREPLGFYIEEIVIDDQLGVVGVEVQRTSDFTELDSEQAYHYMSIMDTILETKPKIFIIRDKF